MHEYRFRGTRKSDGVPVASRMQAQDENELRRNLDEDGIELESVEVLTMGNRDQTVSLGCGTLILIAIIVMIFSNSSDQDVERELRQLKSEVQQLKSAVEAQTREFQRVQRERQSPEQ